MTMTRHAIALAAIYAGLNEVNEQIDPAARLATEPGTVLFGPGSALDSLGLVTLLVTVEQEILKATGCRLTLATDDRIYAEDSPLRTVASFADFLAARLEETGKA